MRLRKLFTAIACLPALLALPAHAAGKCERLVATGNPDHPPFLWRDPADATRLIGAEADLLAELSTRIGVKIELLAAESASTAAKEVSSGRMDLLLGAQPGKAGLTRYDYLYPAYASVPLLVWTREEHAPLFTGLQDLASHQGHVVGRRQMPLALRQRLPLTEATPSAARKGLRRGGMDYVVADEVLGRILFGAERSGLVALHPPLLRESLHLALSHNSACNDAWLRGQLALQLSELQDSGRFARLLETAGERWRSRQKLP